MNRGIVLDAKAVEQLNWGIAANESWLNSISAGEAVAGIRQIERSGFLYLLSLTAAKDANLLVIAKKDGSNFFSMARENRAECFQRILKSALSRLDRGVKVPIEWKPFHTGSLLSFQSNRFTTHIKTRVYMDSSPEGSSHVYVFALVDGENIPLSRVGYDRDVFEDAVLNYEGALEAVVDTSQTQRSGQFSVALTKKFGSFDIGHGVPFSVWRDSKLTKEQLRFFNAPLDGPLRLRGPAGTGKTLVLCLRFLREIYDRLDGGNAFRCAFVTHAQETSDLVRTYLVHMDERGVLPQLNARGVVEVSTLHAIANEFINYDAEEVLPISLDGAEGRTLQMELMQAIADGMRGSKENARELEGESLRLGLVAPRDSHERVAFLCDIIDEFSTVLETYGVRDVDLIAEKYLKGSYSGKSIAKSDQSRHLVLEIYRRFRRELSELGVVSLDQFISDFSAYLNSFRWDSVRGRRGFDFVFADELHLFNRQERQILGYLLREAKGAKRVAVAYDPRQSPRNSFLPQDQRAKDSVWTESNLAEGGQRFELTDVFRYTPEILAFLKVLNGHFPADDLSEEWGLVFGSSMLASGIQPVAAVFDNHIAMANATADSARRMLRRCKSGERVAVLALDHARYATYAKAGIFQNNFVSVSSRDEVGAIQRYAHRAVLSMPEYVAGLQFEHVYLIDANAALVASLGAGANGLQRFVSAVYLGASRARLTLQIFSDKASGGFAAPIRDAMEAGVLVSATA